MAKNAIIFAIYVVVGKYSHILVRQFNITVDFSSDDDGSTDGRFVGVDQVQN